MSTHAHLPLPKSYPGIKLNLFEIHRVHHQPPSPPDTGMPTCEQLWSRDGFKQTHNCVNRTRITLALLLQTQMQYIS